MHEQEPVLPALIDTHVHLDFLADLPRALHRARIAGVGGFVVPGISRAGWRPLLHLVESFPETFAAPGLHPHHAGEWGPETSIELQRLLDHPHSVALGEIGLDRQSPCSQATQETVLRRMLGLACDMNKPVLIHQRRAIGRLLEILDQEQASRVGGILHGFSGSLESARQAIALGFAIGIGRVVTYPEAHRLPALVRQLPAEWLVLETDVPDLSGQPQRRAINHPHDLPLIAARVAALRGWTLEETARITSCNARRLLRLKTTPQH